MRAGWRGQRISSFDIEINIFFVSRHLRTCYVVPSALIDVVSVITPTGIPVHCVASVRSEIWFHVSPIFKMLQPDGLRA